MDYLSSLNEEQQKAVTFSGKHALVIAGAGTGKTRTIIHRAVYLLSQGVRPDKILILSFTRKSANEIVERIKQFQDTGSVLNLSGQTFHSWCSQIIKNNPQVFEQYDYTLLDSEDVDSLFKLLFTQKYKNNKTVDQKLYSKIQSVYSYMLNTRKPLIEAIKIQECGNMSEDETEKYIKDNEDVFKEIMRDYIAYKKKNKLFDYDDLLYITANGLAQNEEARKFISSKYEHILVDEFQDTNPLQYQLLESFYENCHLFCVGDDAQSIYAFRGADFKSMHNFTKIVPDSIKLYLNTNYRSTQEILDISNWLLEQSSIDYNKHLKAYRGQGVKPVIEYMYDEYYEQSTIERAPILDSYDLPLIKIYFEKVYCESDSKDVWYEKLKEFISQYDYAKTVKEYLQDPVEIETPAVIEAKAEPETPVQTISEVFVSPLKGEAKLITETPDPTFAQKMMGDGIVIFPEAGDVYAPCDATIQFVFDTKHAIGMTSSEGIEILIHAGIDTVKLGGKGFKVLVENGQKVAKGDKLMEIDLEYIRANAPSDAVPLVFTNLGEHHLELLKLGQVVPGDELIRVK